MRVPSHVVLSCNSPGWRGLRHTLISYFTSSQLPYDESQTLMRSNNLLPSVTFRFSIAHSFAAFCIASLVVLSGCTGGAGGSGGSGVTTAPAPSITGVSPATAVAGSGPFTLSVSGSNFQAQAVVKWNGTALATTFVSASSLSAAVPASLTAAVATAAITVLNPDGQVSAGGSAAQQVTVTNPAPTLSAVSPLRLYAGSSDTTFTFTGTNFISSSVAMAGSTALVTTLVSSTQLTAVVPAALLASTGTLGLSVSNPSPGGGSSQSISITLYSRPAILLSLSPTSATAGSPAIAVTLTGSNFTPTAVVYLGGFSPVATTFVSSTSIQFTIPATFLGSVGSLSITVRDPAALNIPSNALTLQINNPVPVLNSISPSSITAGTPNVLLTLTGSNFLTSSTILINGTATQPQSYQTSTSTLVVIPASALSTVGTVSIAIQNPAPGGGTSASQTLNVISASNRVRTVNVGAADLGWDSAHNLLIASTLSSSPTNPNSIVAIDPLQGTVKTAQSLPGQPAGISVTGDGSYVYVTLPATGQVERLTLPSLTPDITFSLGNASSGAAFTSSYVVAAPGLPHTVAIARQSNSGGNDESSVAIFDDGVARPNTATLTGIYNVYATLTWGANATTLYGTNTVISTADEDTFTVSSTGVTLLSDKQNGLGEFVKDLAFDTKTGSLIDGYGDVVNAATGQSVGQIQVQNTITYEQNPFALDTTQRIAFYLNAEGFYTSSTPNGTYIEAFNLDQFSYINSLLVEGLSGGSAIVRWGTSGLAINGPQMYIIDGSFIAPSGVSSAVGAYASVTPTLSSISPAFTVAGSADTQVTLTGSNFSQAAEVTWNNQNLLIDSVTPTQITVTIPASSLATAVAGGMSVTNSPGTGSSNALGFSVLPNLGASTQLSVLDISAQDLAWDSTRSLLYVAVPASDATLPNTVSVIDPAKLVVQQTVPVANQPSALSLTDDGQYLYVGSYGQAVVQRYALPSFSLNLSIPTGAGLPATAVGTHDSCTYALDVKAAPGNPQTIAIAQGNAVIDPRGCGGVAIYDNATPRPNTLLYPTSEITSLAWGADASTLFGQDGSLEALPVTSAGVSVQNYLNSGNLNLGLRVHYDSGTKLLYSDSGVITNPVGPAQVGQFTTGLLTATDSTLKRAFVLSASTNPPGNGQGASSYTLQIFDLNTLALLNSIVIPDVLGYPETMTRWGANGLVIGTIGQSGVSGSVGALYVLQGSSISGTP